MSVITLWFLYALSLSLTDANAPFLLVSLGMWSLWAAFVFWLITRIDRLAWVPFKIRLAVFAWSAIMIQLTGVVVGLTGPLIGGTFGQFSIAINAPLVEELIKLAGVVMVALTVPRLFHRPVAAVLCGALSGLGFAFAENWRFSVGLLDEELGGSDTVTKLSELATWVLARGFVDAPWGHMTYTALASVGFYHALRHANRGAWYRITHAVGGFVCAVVLHGLSNASVNLDGSAQLAGYALVSLVELGILVALIGWAVRSNRRIG